MGLKFKLKIDKFMNEIYSILQIFLEYGFGVHVIKYSPLVRFNPCISDPAWQISLVTIKW